MDSHSKVPNQRLGDVYVSTGVLSEEERQLLESLTLLANSTTGNSSTQTKDISLERRDDDQGES